WKSGYTGSEEAGPDVFERCRRTMEQLEHRRVVADVTEWDWKIECFPANFAKLRAQPVATEEWLKELRANLFPQFKTVEVGNLECRKTLRHIQSAIRRDTHLDSVRER